MGRNPPGHIKECRKAGKDAQKLIVGRNRGKRERGGKVGDQEQSTSITHAWPVAEWEVVTDQCRFPLSRERARKGQGGQAGPERTEAFYEKDE